MNNLRKYREAKLLTQAELASKVGVTFKTINRIEMGHSKPHFSLLKKLAETLEVSPEELNLRGDHAETH